MIDAAEKLPASLAIRLHMAAEGWGSDDKITKAGWGQNPGFSIWFTRSDWHGGSAMAMTGSNASYSSGSSEISKIAEVVWRAARRASQAWLQYPLCPPSVGQDGQLSPTKPVIHPSRPEDIYRTLVARPDVGPAVDQMVIDQAHRSILLGSQALLEGDPSLAEAAQAQVGMASCGWDCRTQIGGYRWSGNPFGYSIRFSRWDWHGAKTREMIGTYAEFTCHTPDRTRIRETAVRAADRALRAWCDFPDCPPAETEDGDLLAREPIDGPADTSALIEARMNDERAMIAASIERDGPSP